MKKTTLLFFVFLISLYSVNAAFNLTVLSSTTVTNTATVWNITATPTSDIEAMWVETNATSYGDPVNVTFAGNRVLVSYIPAWSLVNNYANNLLNFSCVSGNCPTKTIIGNHTYGTFDGSTQIIQISDDNRIDNFGAVTAECISSWKSGLGGNTPRLIGKGGTAISWQTRLKDTTQCIVGGNNCISATSSSGTNAEGVTNIGRGSQVYSLTITIDNNNKYAWLNGAIDASGTGGTIANSPDNLRIAQDMEMHSTGWFPGDILFCRVLNMSLTTFQGGGLTNAGRILNVSRNIYGGYVSNTSSFILNHSDNTYQNEAYYRICVNLTTGGITCTPRTLYGTIQSDAAPPNITSYNLTTGLQQPGCQNWNTNKSNPCNTSDTTPLLVIGTDKNAFCAIGVNDSNFDGMGAIRQCDGGGTSEHTCTLIDQDELVYDASYIYVGCKSMLGYQNPNSTSGALTLSITGLETAARDSIIAGIQNSFLGSYAIYTDQKIYARNSANNQAVGTFDKIIKKLNKLWAFNRIGVSDSHVNMFNITPVLYTLEFTNKTSTYIENQTAVLINATK